jgi:hypothetical protein
MGFWGTYTVGFEIEDHDLSDDQMYEISLEAFKEFLPFSRCEGGLDLDVNNMFSPEFSISVRYEGFFDEAKFLAACNRVIKRFAHLGYERAYVKHDLDWSPETDLWYLSESGDCFEYDKDYSEYVTERTRKDILEQLEKLENEEDWSEELAGDPDD